MNLRFCLVAILLLGIFYGWTSRINGIFFFGRTVGTELCKSKAGRAITRQYRILILLATALSTASSVVLHSYGRHFAQIGILLIAISQGLLFARANGQVQRLLQQGRNENCSTVVQVALLESSSY